eukprot:TRINITY_DN2638_c0_g3_i9.p2 TRINITY_DN2638_c0_g3~~TRINITY_DN2638_c0_g3_i9.p2  ORF type:complete len:103 (-),score=23.52 TRINITY_DN2638_c0_g3_i9:178-486(-)
MTNLKIHKRLFRIHNADSSVNLQKAVTEARNVISLDVIAKHNIIDAVVLAPQVSALSCHVGFHSRGTGNANSTTTEKELSILLSFVTISLSKIFECSLQAHR